MNALFELIGNTVYVTQEESETIADTPEYTVEFVPCRLNRGRYKGKIRVNYHYKSTSKIAKDFINNVSFAKVQYSHYDDNLIIAELHSNRTENDEIKFLETLDSINYDDGYGIQELFGNIVFKDGTWLERREYDGSEWWAHCKLPTEEDLFNNNKE